MKKILVLLSDLCEEIEVIVPVDIWRRAGIEVVTASIQDYIEIEGQQKIRIKADILLKEVRVSDFDGIFIPGGSGVRLIRESSEAMNCIKESIKLNKYIIAICAAPTIIKDYLQDKKATCYPKMKDELAHWIDKKVVIDLPFITSQGAGTAFDLGYEVVGLLQDLESKKELEQKMIYHR